MLDEVHVPNVAGWNVKVFIMHCSYPNKGPFTVAIKKINNCSLNFMLLCATSLSRTNEHSTLVDMWMSVLRSCMLTAQLGLPKTVFVCKSERRVSIDFNESIHFYSVVKNTFATIKFMLEKKSFQQCVRLYQHECVHYFLGPSYPDPVCLCVAGVT